MRERAALLVVRIDPMITVRGEVACMEICGAKNRQGNPCRRPAGWGTDHVGQGRCKLHGGRSPGVKGNTNSVKTGEGSKVALSRADEFAEACKAAPIDPTTMLQEQARRTAGRLDFMYRLLWQTEEKLEQLAAAGDTTAVHALAVVEQSRKREPRIVGEGDKQTTRMVQVELSEKSRSLLDTWHAQHDAITRVELLYGRTAERLKPREGGPTGGGIGTLIINNSMPGVED